MTVAALRSVYDSWKDMDLYLAGLLEKVEKDRQGRRKQVIYIVGKNSAICYVLIDYFITLSKLYENWVIMLEALYTYKSDIYFINNIKFQ